MHSSWMNYVTGAAITVQINTVHVGTNYTYSGIGTLRGHCLP